VDAPLHLTISELAAGLRRRQFSALELARAALDRLDSEGRRYNAVASLMPDRALREARAADARRRSGRRIGVLDGIPYGAKDLVAARGARTTWGAPPFARQVLDFDAAVVESLRAAGAILVAKLAMIELAGGGGYRYPSASLQGPCRNPWNVEHWSGGSSSGTGAAVGAGLVPFGIGSETSGSILSPSSNCGVTGLRPTYGLVSRYGAMALAWTMDKLGPMCRSAEDCGLVLEAIAGADPRDPGSAGRGFRMRRAGTRRLSDVRVGYLGEDFEEGVQPVARPAMREALAAFRSLGVRWKRVSLPALPIDAAARTIIRAEGSAVFRDLLKNGRVPKLADRRQALGLVAGLQVTAVDYLSAMRVRRMLQEALARIFTDVDVILAPSRFAPAGRIDEPLDPLWRTRPPGRGRARQRAPRGVALVPAGNLAGLPGLSLPCGSSTTALPLAVQIVGRPFDEALVLDLGRAYQSVTDWHRRLPPGLPATPRRGVTERAPMRAAPRR
jgi:aspartyl-tRNA(Asn)/glutamyl-tRNA(Gln) amidotransferase subunit A